MAETVTAAGQYQASLAEMLRDPAMTEFVRQSYAIGGAPREIAKAETKAHAEFLLVGSLTIGGVENLMTACVPGAVIRTEGAGPRMGRVVAPPGGPYVREVLDRILNHKRGAAGPWWCHYKFQRLQPFSAGNGIAARALWLRLMFLNGDLQVALRDGFLKTFYRQTLEWGK